MLVLTQTQLSGIAGEAESAYPDECCGLLVGRRIKRDIVVARAVPSPNLALDESGAPRRRDRFEVDPEIRLRVMRECEGGEESIVGHYHSHPDHPPEPSAHDLAMALEPELVWLIVGVEKGRAGAVTAHELKEGTQAFREVPLRILG